MDNGSKLILHTHTPILEAISANPKHDGVLFPKRWNLRTPRGDIRTSIVIHATNAYTGYLLPFLGPNSNNRSITPVRGQVIATKAAVSAGHFKRGSYDANDGFEYWFSRPVKNFPVDQPLVILGGGRESAGPNYEIGVADDSTVNPNVSKSLREFLPHLYPNGWFPENRTPEMEWVRQFHSSSRYIHNYFKIDRDNGVYAVITASRELLFIPLLISWRIWIAYEGWACNELHRRNLSRRSVRFRRIYRSRHAKGIRMVRVFHSFS